MFHWISSPQELFLFKKGKVVEMDKYGPISKLLERAVHHQLYQYLREHNILSPFQCGFRKCHSTKFAALSLADTIRRNMDQGMLTGAVFIDFRKAFDSVNHDSLLQKLSYMGVLDKELAWFKDSGFGLPGCIIWPRAHFHWSPTRIQFGTFTIYTSCKWSSQCYELLQYAYVCGRHHFVLHCLQSQCITRKIERRT